MAEALKYVFVSFILSLSSTKIRCHDNSSGYTILVQENGRTHSGLFKIGILELGRLTYSGIDYISKYLWKTSDDGNFCLSLSRNPVDVSNLEIRLQCEN